MGAALFEVLGLVVAALVAVFAIAYFASRGSYTVAKTVTDDPSIPHLTLDGYAFHSEAFGSPDNPTLIVVHGGPGFDYRALLPLKALSDDYYVVFYDQRGTGLSPRVAGDGPDLASSIHDLDLFVAHFGAGKKVNIVGHSWGGMLASAYVGKHPEKVAALVLAEPGFLTSELFKQSGVKLGPPMEVGFLWRAAKAWFQSLHIDKKDDQARMDYLFGQIAPYANPDYYCGGVVPEKGTECWRVGSKPLASVLGSTRDKDGHFNFNLVEGVERYRDEVLFIASGCNSLIGKSFQEKQMKLFASAKLVVIQDCGHMLFGEKPIESVQIVRDFLDAQKSNT